MTKWLLAFVCLLPLTAQAQVQPLFQPYQTFVDNSGNPCAGCKLYSYAAGTTTPQATYTDSSGSVQNTNPIVLNAAGGAAIWMGSSAYKFALLDTYGTTLWTVDNVLAPEPAGGGPYLPLAGGTMTGSIAMGANNITGAGTISAATINGTTISGTTGTFSGVLTVNGNLLAQSDLTVGAEGFDNYIKVLPAQSGGAIFYIDNSSNLLRIGNGAPGNEALAYSVTGTLHVPNAVDAVTGDFSTSVTSPSFLGNSTTATDLQTYPAKCTGSQFSQGLSSGSNNCATPGSGVVVQATHLGSASCSPAGSSYATCTDVLTWPTAFADTNYRAVCNAVGPVGGGSGSNSLLVYVEGSSDTSPPTTTTITAVVENNSSDSGTTAADIYCIGVHN